MKLRHNRIMTDALREIRHTRSRFLSLLVLSALSVCFLAGLRATAPDMKNSADLYFDQQRLMDLRITSTLGLTEEDAAALERQEGVLAVERAYTVDAMVHLTDDDYIVKVLSFTESPGLNAPKLVEGRRPQTAGECLVEPLLLEETGLSLGDAIALDTGSGSYEDALALVPEGGDPGGGKDPGGLHAVGGQEGIELRDGRIGIVGKIHGPFQIVHGNVEHGELAADKIDAFDAGHGR